MRTTMDYAVAIVLLGALTIGLGSMLIGKVIELWDALVSRVSRGKGVRSVELPAWMERREKAGIKLPVPVSVSVSSTDTGGFDLDAVPSDLTYEEVVTILAGQMTPTGKPLYSGRKIYSLVGGNYNEFTTLMRELRSKDDAPAEPPPVVTPIAKRPTRATFQENDPELVRQPLP